MLLIRDFGSHLHVSLFTDASIPSNTGKWSTNVRAVVDYGPSCFVEDDAGGPVIDASPAVCQALTGGSSCGWSDHFSVTASVVGDNRPFGPFTLN